MQSTEILQPLAKKDVPKLLQVLSRDFPHSSWVYHWIKSQRKLAKKLPRVRVLVLCPYGDWTTGTVVALNIGLENNCQVYGVVHSNDKDGALLKRCLVESDTIPWRAISEYITVSGTHADVFIQALQTKGLQIKHQANCANLHMPSAEASLVQIPDLPEGARIAPLDANRDLDTVWDNWPHFHPDFRPVVRAMIQFNPSYGLFVPSGTLGTDEEELASMLVQSDAVGISILQTLSRHRRKGFATILLSHATKEIGRSGTGAQCRVLTTNNVSLELFKKVGFTTTGYSTMVSLAGDEILLLNLN